MSDFMRASAIIKPDELKDVLNNILPHTTFDVGNIDYTEHHVPTLDRRRPDRMIRPAELRDLVRESTWNSNNRKRAVSARPMLDDSILESLTSILRKLLTDYINPETDRLRHHFPAFIASTGGVTHRRDGLVEKAYQSIVSNFALGLIKSAAILGADHVASLLCGWITGEPIKYRIYSMLYGAHIKHDIDLLNGVRITSLPLSSDKLPVSFPEFSSIDIASRLGQTVVSLDCELQPAFHPVQSQSTSDGVIQFSTPLDGAPIHTLYEAMSLACNRYMNYMMQWQVYSDADSLVGVSNDGGVAYGPGNKLRRWRGLWKVDSLAHVTSTTVTDECEPVLSRPELELAWSILHTLERRKHEDQRFKVAFDRWFRCIRPNADLADQYIDLRIALEALYLDSTQGELRFRLAITGSWHLGKNWSERKAIQESLLKFYDDASSVIHGARSKENKSQLQRLEEAKSLCRRGLLKAIEQQNRPNWRDLILGREIEQRSSTPGLSE